MNTLTFLHKKYGLLLTIEELAEVLDRSPQGLRITLRSSQGDFAKLKEGRRKIGRRVYYSSAIVAKMIDGETNGNSLRDSSAHIRSL